LVGFGNVKRLQVPAEGVYSAYNAGISNSDGRYLLFFGVDDIALPGMDAVIAHLYEKPDAYVLYAGACYMQSRGVHRPSTKRTSLIFANWCHQGIFYKREYLASHHYEVRYRMQADHKMNIDIISNRSFSFGVSHEMVAYFSAGGVSSVSPDLVFRKNFSSIVSDAYGRHWGLFIILKQKLIDIILGSPEKRFRPYEKN
jgi:glycosyltransferase involved in cell wall biosynthesis